MRAGRLRDLIEIQELTVEQDEYGGTYEEWNTWKHVWAKIEFLRGRTLFEAQAAASEAQGRIYIRHVDGISPEMRIKHGDKYLEILSVLPADNKSREIEILFREWLDNG